MDPMITCVIIFVLAYALIVTERFDSAVIALIGAGAMVMCNAANFNLMLAAVDLNVLGLLIGMMIIINIMSTTGVFEWLAVVIAKQTRGNGILVVIEFMLATAFVSAFMDNVTTVILMAPVTILISQLLGLPTIPILILEAIFSNIGGTATLIGDPPNILIGGTCGLSFNDFAMNLAPGVLLILLVTLTVFLLIFRNKFKSDASAIARVMQTEPHRAILKPGRLRNSLIVFVLIIAAFIGGRFFNLEPGLIALVGSVVMVLVCGVKLEKMLERVDWLTILFFCGLFMMVSGLEQNGLFKVLGDFLMNCTGGDFTLTLIVILWGTGIISAIVNNIPLVIAMIPLIIGILPSFIQAQYPDLNLTDADIRMLMNPDNFQALTTGNFASLSFSNPEIANHLSLEMVMDIKQNIIQPFLWVLALGACLGGNGTLIGASANVVIDQIARKNNYEIGFKKFSMYGFPLMILSLIISTAYIYFRYIM